MSILLLSDEQRKIIQDTWRLIAEPGIQETATKIFYEQLFANYPSTRGLFPQDMSSQIGKLAATLDFAVKAMNWDSKNWQEGHAEPEKDLFHILLAMGRRHQLLYRAEEAHYGPVGESLLKALDLGLGPAFTPEAREAWTILYTNIAKAMVLGSKMVTPEDKETLGVRA